jgi:hypothetical protein
MTNIITVTANPAIDVTTAVERLAPNHKLRCTSARRDPGGGGINVARVLKRLGADVVALYPAGGVLGTLLRKLVDEEGIPCLTTAIAEETREDITIVEQSSGQQYRFILPGPRLNEQEWQACLDALASARSCCVGRPPDALCRGERKLAARCSRGLLRPGHSSGPRRRRQARPRCIGSAAAMRAGCRCVSRQAEPARVQGADGQAG